MSDLFIKHDDDSSFSDFSVEGRNYLRDTFDIVLTTADFLYVGLFKPFDRIFIEMNTANTNSATLTGEFYNGTSFTALSNYEDATNALTRSGFMRWDRSQTDWAETTIDGVEAFWVRFSTDTNFSAGTIASGLNLIFADDVDLQEEYRDINDFLGDDTSFIATHQSVRNDIVNKVRRQGKRKMQDSATKYENMTQWDFLDLSELRDAAKYYALHKIFLNASDSTDGKFNQLMNSYRAKGDEAFTLFFMSLDLDDDGVLDDGESAAISFSRIVRL